MKKRDGKKEGEKEKNRKNIWIFFRPDRMTGEKKGLPPQGNTIFFLKQKQRQKKRKSLY